jgi:2-haloacid dehalogenase
VRHRQAVYNSPVPYYNIPALGGWRGSRGDIATGGSIGMAQALGVKALTFDVFGTVVDWRSSIIREGRELGRAKGLDVNWETFTDAWRQLYQPMLEKVRSGALPWKKLDDLHRMSLDRLLGEFGIAGLTESEIDHLNRVWHRLDPWPDSVPGLTRLHKKFILATLSNGNVALLVNMARRAGLPWDAILGAEPTRHYKPQPEAYLGTAEYLGLRPEECMLVAAHNNDLVAASSVGFRTGFVRRPTEYGPSQSRDLKPEHRFDLVAESMVDLAAKLGC